MLTISGAHDVPSKAQTFLGLGRREGEEGGPAVLEDEEEGEEEEEEQRQEPEAPPSLEPLSTNEKKSARQTTGVTPSSPSRTTLLSASSVIGGLSLGQGTPNPALDEGCDDTSGGAAGAGARRRDGGPRAAGRARARREKSKGGSGGGGRVERLLITPKRKYKKSSLSGGSSGGSKTSSMSSSTHSHSPPSSESGHSSLFGRPRAAADANATGAGTGAPGATGLQEGRVMPRAGLQRGWVVIDGELVSDTDSTEEGGGEHRLDDGTTRPIDQPKVGGGEAELMFGSPELKGPPPGGKEAWSVQDEGDPRSGGGKFDFKSIAKRWSLKGLGVSALETTLEQQPLSSSGGSRSSSHKVGSGSQRSRPFATPENLTGRMSFDRQGSKDGKARKEGPRAGARPALAHHRSPAQEQLEPLGEEEVDHRPDVSTSRGPLKAKGGTGIGSSSQEGEKGEGGFLSKQGALRLKALGQKVELPLPPPPQKDAPSSERLTKDPVETTPGQGKGRPPGARGSSVVSAVARLQHGHNHRHHQASSTPGSGGRGGEGSSSSVGPPSSLAERLRHWESTHHRHGATNTPAT
ncbi:unnamed protein product, partial [Discosporangium mesarthrocarpum]